MKNNEQTPLSETDYLLVKLAEECAEVAKEITKALTFGLDDTHPTKPDYKPIRERLALELDDLHAAQTMLIDRGVLRGTNIENVMAKRDKVDKFMRYSRERNRLAA
jgi:hypothetical protein